MKLLMGQSVVLVEHPDLEPQLFAPILSEDGVTLEKMTINISSGSPLGQVQNEDPPHSEDVIKDNQIDYPVKLRHPVDKAVDHLQQRKRMRFHMAPKTQKNLEPSRECVVHGRKLQNKNIRHVPPPFDVNYKIFYLGR
ncbi:hypothetical protein KR026_002084, partial [Drosophila bipectinata]